MSNEEDEFPLIEMRGDDDEENGERDYECFNQERYEQEEGFNQWEEEQMDEGDEQED